MSGSRSTLPMNSFPAARCNRGQTAETGKVAACYSQIKHNNSLPKQLHRRVRNDMRPASRNGRHVAVGGGKGVESGEDELGGAGRAAVLDK